MPAISTNLEIYFNSEENNNYEDLLKHSDTISLYKLKRAKSDIFCNIYQNFGFKITLLDLSFSKINGNELSLCLQKCNQLKSLFLDSCYHLDEKNLKKITSYSPHLNKLSLSQTEGLTDWAASKVITKGSKLKFLNLGWQVKLKEETIAKIAEYCLDLKELYLMNCKNLKCLTLQKIVSNCKNLKILNIDWCRNLKLKEISFISDIQYSSSQGIY